MQYKKSRLVAVAKRVEQNRRLTPHEIQYLLTFEKTAKERTMSTLLKQVALPLSLLLGFFFHVFPATFEQTASSLPSWTNIPPSLLSGIDYLWDILGEPVNKANIVYHIPNIILYSFGIFGIKKIIDTLDKRNWLDRVLAAQKILTNHMQNGKANLNLTQGHSILFVGKGDFIGMQFALSTSEDQSVTISESKPPYTDVWNYYSVDTLYDDLKSVLKRCDGEQAGEYVFFPVKDDQIFLPSSEAYDVSPHKLDILCQNIRTIEKELKWPAKRIILVGDRNHKNFVQSEDRSHIVPHSKDIISLTSIAKKYKNITLLDPTEIVLKKVIEIADGRRIVFRATKSGIAEYKKRFYERLDKLKYKPKKAKKGILTIGYDIFEDQTEQQMLSRKIDDYFPVVLSKNVHDALIRNGYRKKEFLYVPDLVLKELRKTAAEQ